jgi:hypothetical protein
MTKNINDELTNMNTAHSALQEQYAVLDTEFKAEKARAKKQELQDKMAFERLNRENDMNLRNEKEESQKALLQQQERFEADMKLLKME